MRAAPRADLRFPNLIRRSDLIAPAAHARIKAALLGQAPWPVYLWGPTGTGKTCAGLCAHDAAAFAIYWPLPDAVMANQDKERAAGLWRGIADADLLVIDEVGERMAGWLADAEFFVLKRIADERERRKHRAAIYIGNIPPQQLAEVYDDRIASRLLCGTVIELAGDDRRRK